jgi:hypothetical protein
VVQDYNLNGGTPAADTSATPATSVTTPTTTSETPGVIGGSPTASTFVTPAVTNIANSIATSQGTVPQSSWVNPAANGVTMDSLRAVYGSALGQPIAPQTEAAPLAPTVSAVGIGGKSLYDPKAPYAQNTGGQAPPAGTYDPWVAAAGNTPPPGYVGNGGSTGVTPPPTVDNKVATATTPETSRNPNAMLTPRAGEPAPDGGTYVRLPSGQVVSSATLLPGGHHG